MDPIYLHFWAKQNAYILNVIYPVSIGSCFILIGLAALFVYTFRQQHYRLWRLGKEEDCSDQIPERLKTFLSVVFGHARFWRGEGYPGTMHFLIFWGTILVFLGKGIRLFSPLTGLTVPPQGVYLFASCHLRDRGRAHPYRGGDGRCPAVRRQTVAARFETR